MIVNRTRYNALRTDPEIIRAKELYRSGDRIGATRILAKYDIVDPRKDNGQHRRAEIERKSEDKLLKSYNRMKLINLLRDAERNASNARGMLLQIRLNVASGIKMRINSEDEDFNKAASFWFNTVFAHECNFEDDDTLEDLAENVIAARFREGDCLAVFDPMGTNEPVLKIFEADQLPDLEEKSMKEMAKLYPWIEAKYTCEQGVILDTMGRVAGYAVTSEHGGTVDLKRVTCYKRNDQARLLRKKWRFDQFRGIPDFAASLTDILDIYDMRSKELQTAKLAASLAIVSESQEERDAIADAAESANVAGLFSDDSSSSSPSEPGIEDISIDREEMDDWHDMTELTGGKIKKATPGEKISALDIDRPNLNAQAFYEAVTGTAGAGIGLMKCYARGEVSTSYTAFRGEMVMTWAQFRACQKWLERQFLDWVARKAIDWAIRAMAVPGPTDPMWQYRISWTFPRMPAVDPEKESKARISDLGAGFSDYSSEFGPDWEHTFNKLGKEKDAAERNGLHLSPFTQMPGTPGVGPEPVKDPEE
jgi:capsid protein